MSWDRPTQHQWCTRNGRVVIERAFCGVGFEIKFRSARRDYCWVRDDVDEVRLFENLLQAKAFARKELIIKAAGG